MKSGRAYFNPVNWLPMFNVDCSHITFNPDVIPQYRIYSPKTTNDGTEIFFHEIIGLALERLVYKRSFYRPTEPDWTKFKDIRYIIGLARVATVYGKVMLPCSKTHAYPGQRERIMIPVRCEYIMKEE